MFFLFQCCVKSRCKPYLKAIYSPFQSYMYLITIRHVKAIKHYQTLHVYLKATGMLFL